jgi:hypothetical protein
MLAPLPFAHAALAAAIAASPPAAAAAPIAAEQIFACGFSGGREVAVTRDEGRLTYRFGRRGVTEMVLTGDQASGNVFYHRTMYAHAEDQTLRFSNGAVSYVVFGIWSAPNYQGEGGGEWTGLLVLRDGRAVARLNCRTGGELTEHPIFFTLPQDAENRVPAR